MLVKFLSLSGLVLEELREGFQKKPKNYPLLVDIGRVGVLKSGGGRELGREGVGVGVLVG